MKGKICYSQSFLQRFRNSKNATWNVQTILSSRPPQHSTAAFLSVRSHSSQSSTSSWPHCPNTSHRQPFSSIEHSCPVAHPTWALFQSLSKAITALSKMVTASTKCNLLCLCTVIHNRVTWGWALQCLHRSGHVISHRQMQTDFLLIPGQVLRCPWTLGKGWTAVNVAFSMTTLQQIILRIKKK